MATLQQAAHVATRSLPIEEANILAAEFDDPKTPYERVVKALAIAARDRSTVLSILAALEAGGPAKGGWVPALGLAPAGAAQIHLRASGSGRSGPRFSVTASGPDGSKLAWSSSFDIADAPVPQDGGSAEAAVPPIPPRVRAKLNLPLHAYLVMWEADWARIRRREKRSASGAHPRPASRPALLRFPPPRDPVVLQPLEPRSDLAVLIATWDLTTLERAALEAIGGTTAFPATPWNRR